MMLRQASSAFRFLQRRCCSAEPVSEASRAYFAAVANEAVVLSKAMEEGDSDAKVQKRFGAIKRYFDPALEYAALLKEEADAAELAEDPDLKEMAEEELAEVRTKMAAAEAAFDSELVLIDEADESDVFLETVGGAGGAEGHLFAKEMFEAYRAYAHSMSWTFEEMDDGGKGTEDYVEGNESEVVNSARISGHDVFRHMKWEMGVHRVQRVPQTEVNGRIHTSTAGVRVLPVFVHDFKEFDPSECQLIAVRSQGPGGQGVNSTNSCCHLHHIPTGIQFYEQTSRTFGQNKETALQRIKARLWELEQEEIAKEKQEHRSESSFTLDRHNKIRTYNWDREAVLDHRLETREAGTVTLGEFFDDDAGGVETLVERLIAQDSTKRRSSWLLAKAEELQKLPLPASASAS